MGTHRLAQIQTLLLALLIIVLGLRGADPMTDAIVVVVSVVLAVVFVWLFVQQGRAASREAQDTRKLDAELARNEAMRDATLKGLVTAVSGLRDAAGEQLMLAQRADEREDMRDEREAAKPEGILAR